MSSRRNGRRRGAATEEERARMIEDRKEVRRERMGMRADRLRKAKEIGQKAVLDLEFGDLTTGNETHSLVQQDAKGNWKPNYKGFLDLTDGSLKRRTDLNIEALQDQKENLVYLTADAETILDELVPRKIYIIGALVDQNRWKGITLKKANDQGIQSARLTNWKLLNYVKLSGSYCHNQVVEILLKFLETRDWKDAFFQVIPQRKRGGGEGDAETEEIVRGLLKILQN